MRVWFLAVALLFVPCVLGATLHGTVYDQDLSVAKGVIVTIDTQPLQRLLSTDGGYSFEVPPGNYTMTVLYLQQGENATMTDVVAVAQEGIFTFDLFLFPDLDEEEALLDLTDEDVTAGLEDFGGQTASTGDGPWPLLILVIVLLLILIVPVVWLRRRFKQLNAEYAALSASGKKGRTGSKPGSETLGEETAAVDLDPKLQEIVDLFRAEDGRMTQKELRSKLPYSEAKVSLMVTELEHRGLLKRIRKGRANVLVLIERR